MDYNSYKKKMKKLGPLPEDMRVFWVGSDLARIEARTTYVLECISQGREILAALDDMAQIIGPKAPLVEDREKDIIDALMDSGAVLVKATAEAKGGDLVENEKGELVSSKKEYSIWDRGYAITTGRDPYEAYVALTVLEKAAEVEIKSEPFGGTEPLSISNAKKQRRKYLREYSLPGIARRKAAGFGGTNRSLGSNRAVDESADASRILAGETAETLLAEFEGREKMVSYGNKLLEQGLVQGTWGNISVRIDNDFMLVTPSGLDYDILGPEDMVKVGIEKLDWDKSENSPTSEKLMHAGIYKARPDVGAVVHTHSKNCSILAACRMPLEVREETIASQIGDILPISEYGEAGSHLLTKNVVDALGAGIGCIMANHGMVACGKDLEEAYSNAEAMEEAARRLVNDVAIKAISRSTAQE